MALIFIVVAALIGLMLAEASPELLGLGIGAAVGYLFFKFRELESQRRSAEQREPRRVAPASTTPTPVPRPEPIDSSDDLLDNVTGEPLRAAAARPTASLFKPQAESAQLSTEKQARAATPLEKISASVSGWITTGNVPVKVGIIILFFGIAFLFKYALDHRILVLPIELRLFGVATLAGLIFGVGWKLRTRSSVYALNLQGAGIGLLFLTIYASFQLYGVLPGSAAFGLMVLLTVGSGTLAVRQDSRGLVVFASIGGFLAPLLASTGGGNHVALFTYYLIINMAILGVSWFRAWRSVNLVGFVFTFGVGTYWGFEFYTPELYSSSQPFLILNFLFYQAIAVLFAFRQAPNLKGLVDGTIVFGTPAMVFGLQSQLVLGTDWGLAISAAVMSLFYAGVGAWLRQRHGKRMQLLSQSMLVLAVGFATIAVPLALDDRWSAIGWALEGAGVVWLGVKQNGVLARITGSVLVFGSGYFFFEHGWRYDAGPVLLNGNVLGGITLGGAAIFAARLLGTDNRKLPYQTSVSVALLMWGATWWLGTGAMEIGDRVSARFQLEWFVTFFAASFILLAGLAKYRNWSAARRLTFTYLPALLPLSLFYLWENHHLFNGWSILIWLFAFAAHFVLLRLAESESRRTIFLWHIAGTLLIVALCSHETFWRVQSAGLAFAWKSSAGLSIPLLASGTLLFFRRLVSWPLKLHWRAYLTATGLLVTGQLVLMLVTAIESPGNPLPLAYIPLLNPYDMLTALGLGMGYWTIREWQSDFANDSIRISVALLGVFAFMLTTLVIVRAVHHMSGLTWNDFVLLRSVSVQAALSIYWAMLGFGGMIIGTRQSQYWLWIVGVGLMVIVVLKLFFVDLGNTGTVARIVSFLAVGALLMIVGYFAPRPPRPGMKSQEQMPG